MKTSRDKRSDFRPGGLRTIFRSLKHKNFRLFFMGQSISLVGTWIQSTAMPWLVFDITHSVVLLGVVGFAGQIPMFLFSSFAGVLSDRWNRHRILIVTQALSMLQALLLAILYMTGVIQVWHIVVLSASLGCVNALDIPARQSFMVEMVGSKKDLGNAIALNSTMVNAARLVGPSIAGVLIAVMGEGSCFLINGLSYIVVIASLLRMNIVPRTRGAGKKHVLHELKEGFSYTFGFAPIKYVILLLSLVSIMGISFVVLMPVFAREVLRGGPHTFGFLMGAIGLGALIAALYLASKRSVLGLVRLIPLAAGVFGAGLIAFSLSRTFLLSSALLVIAGLGLMLQMAASNTILQTIVDDDMRGRVMSFYAMAFMGTAPFGSLLSGFFAKMLGAPVTIMIGGISCIIGAVLFARELPRLRKMIRPIYIRLGIISEVTP